MRAREMIMFLFSERRRAVLSLLAGGMLSLLTVDLAIGDARPRRVKSFPGDACSQDQECNDGNPCTADACNFPDRRCVYTPVVCTALNQCHLAGTCDPSTGACANPAKDDGSACDDGNPCTIEDACAGGNCVSGTLVNCNDDNPCTIDSCGSTGCVNVPGNAGTECRAAAGDCDLAEVCSGSSAACPADSFVSGGTVCRASTGECDAVEVCSGASPTCPPDAIAPDGTNCTDDGIACTNDYCSAGACAHPDFPAGTACGNQTPTGPCDQADVCDGRGMCVANPSPAGTVCRAAARDCDRAELCDGMSSDCPFDRFEPEGTACDDGDPETTGEACADGNCVGGTPVNCNDNNPCTVDSSAPAGCVHVPGNAGTPCRASAGPCDAAEVCDGISAACPPDGFQQNGTSCDDGDPSTCGDACSGGSCSGLPENCLCGNGLCDPGESSCTCLSDCGSNVILCGDGCCDSPNGETACNCPADCLAVCGDGCCDFNQGENVCNCPADCPFGDCGDGCCEPGEDVTCPRDCP